MGEFLQCLLVKRTWTATLHPCRYRQTPEYTHGRQPTYMSCSVPRVFFVFDLAIFTRNEAHSLLFPNIVPKDDAKVQNFFDIPLASLRFMIKFVLLTLGFKPFSKILLKLPTIIEFAMVKLYTSDFFKSLNGYQIHKWEF